MNDIAILNAVKEYYDEKLAQSGPTAAGVDWNSAKSQIVRFEQLIKMVNNDDEFSLNDYGCGYGALYDYLLSTKNKFSYIGFDVSENMILQARDIHQHHHHYFFTSAKDELPVSDYTVASGIFNVKLSATNPAWLQYIQNTLQHMDKISKKGFSFNCLTAYSDQHMMRDYLYYADPLYFFDYCKKHYSRNIALLHDYDLYEFTILVRKQF